MRVIITGGTGMIGSALTPKLIAAGHEVIILSRNPGRVSSPPAGARLVQWDAKTAAGWGDLIDGNTTIINLAGANIAGTNFFPERWTDQKKALIIDSRNNAGAAVEAAVAAAADKPRAVLQVSGVGYYGVKTGDQALNEDAPPGTDFLAKVCVDWEASTAAVKDHGVRHIVMRTGIVLSTKEGALARTIVPYKFFVGGPFGNGQQWWSWIHLDDQVDAIHFLVESESAEGVYNLCSPTPMRNKDFGKALGQVMSRPSLFPVPAFAMNLMFGEVAIVVLEGQKVIPTRLQQDGFTFTFPEVKPAFADLIERGI